MAKELSAAEVREKLERNVRIMSKWAWFMKLGLVVTLAVFLLAFFLKDQLGAAVFAFVACVFLIGIVRQNLHKLVLKLTAPAEEEQVQ